MASGSFDGKEFSPRPGWLQRQFDRIVVEELVSGRMSQSVGVTNEHRKEAIRLLKERIARLELDNDD